MASFLQLNLAVLRERNPVLADRIAALDSELPPDLECISTPSRMVAARFIPRGGGSSRALCSTYDPLREAERWAETDPVSSPINLIFLGVGLGYHVLKYLERFGRYARSVTLIEFYPHLFRLALSVGDFRAVLRAESCLCLVGERLDDLSELLAPLRTQFMVHNIKILHHRPSQHVNEPYYLDAARRIVELATFDEVNTRTVLGQRQRNQENVLRNLQAIWRGVMPAQLRDAASGLPALVVAAGPSLDRNVAELHRLGSRGIIICVDTSQNTLAKHGIAPHIVTTADPTELNYTHFEQIDDLGDAVLAFHPECYFGITRKYRSHPYMFPLIDEHGKLLSHLREVLSDELGGVGHVPRGMNVGQIAFNVACHLGCDPIILVGMDFAFAPDGGLTHTEHAALSRTTSPVGEDRMMTVGAKPGRAGVERGNVVFVEGSYSGYYGGQVPTSPSFQQYIKDLERTIERSDRRVIDATEGGARKRGAEVMSLREAIDTLDKSVSVDDFLRRLRQPPPSRDPRSLVAELRRGQSVLVESKRICERAIEHISRWPGIFSGPVATAGTVQHEWDELESMWQRMLADPLFNIFLDTAVTYLYYRRMRADQPADNSPGSFLECMYRKYQFILTEMNLTLEHFIAVVDEVCEEFSFA